MRSSCDDCLNSGFFNHTSSKSIFKDILVNPLKRGECVAPTFNYVPRTISSSNLVHLIHDMNRSVKHKKDRSARLTPKISLSKAPDLGVD